MCGKRDMLYLRGLALLLMMQMLYLQVISYKSSSRRLSLPHRAIMRMVTTGRDNERPTLPPNVKDRHRRRPVAAPQDEEAPYSGGGQERRGGGGGGVNGNGRGRGTNNAAVSTDPWKVLIRKLDATKASKEVFGKVEKVVESYPDQLQCKHFATCAGCSQQGNFSDTPIVRRARSYFASEGLRFETHLGNYTHWRTHVKLAVQPLSRWGGLKIGLYKEGTHDVEAIPDCRVHHPRINEAVEELKRAATDVGVRGYEEAKNGLPSEGELRYLQMSLERESNKVQLVLVWNANTYKDAEQTLPRLVKRLRGRADLWHSVSVNFQTSESNAIFNLNSPKAWKLLWGPPTLREKIGNAYFFFRPQIFRQANLEAFGAGILPNVVKNVPAGSKVAELYSGIGVLGLNVASRAQEVLCSDSNEYVEEVFDKCADSLLEGDQDKVFYENLPAEEAVDEGQCEEAEVLIVDPPRRGLDQGVLKLLLNTHETASAPALTRLIYVSCGFDALEKDSRALVASGMWRLKSADGYLLFPGSDHVETVAVFDRRVGADAAKGEIEREAEAAAAKAIRFAPSSASSSSLSQPRRGRSSK